MHKAGAIVVSSVVLAVLAYLAYQLSKNGGNLKAAASTLVDAINPASDQNVVYQTANAITRAVSGNPEATLGTELWERLHPGQVKLENAVTNITGRAQGAAPATGEELSAYWAYLSDPGYLDALARQEKITGMHNLRQPVRSDSGDLWLVG